MAMPTCQSVGAGGAEPLATSPFTPLDVIPAKGFVEYRTDSDSEV